MHLGGKDWAEIGIEPVGSYAIKDEVDGRGIGDVRLRHEARTTSEEATDASTTVNDHRTGVALFREATRFGVEREDGPFFGGLGLAVVGVVAGVGAYVISTANG